MPVLSAFMEQLHQTAKFLIGQVYVDIEMEEQKVNKTARCLVKKVYGDIEMEEEKVSKIAKSLVEQIYEEIHDELSLYKALLKKQKKLDLKRTLAAAKRREVVRGATLNRKRASKETRATLMYQIRIENTDREVQKLEKGIEMRESEAMEVNCDLEELIMEKKTLNEDEMKAKENLKEVMSLVDMLKEQHDMCYTQAEATMSELKKLRRKTYKLTKWQRLKSFFSRCFGGVEHHYVRDRETKVDEIINECDAVLFATSSTRTILGDC